MDSITERLALLALDNRHRTLTEAADLRLGYGLCGALVLDLIHAGALRAQADGTLIPHPQARLDAAYLREAFDAVPSYVALGMDEALKALYAIMPRLKERVLGALVDGGFVVEGMTKLKWSFSLRTYALKPEHAGYRARALQALRQGSIGLRDSRALQVADACGLLWPDEGEDKKAFESALRRLRKLEHATEHMRLLTGHLAAGLPDSIARSHKLPALGKKAGYKQTWEWRGFWPGKGPTLIRASERYTLPPSGKVDASGVADEYIVIEGVADNIKCRKASLEVKTPLETRDGHTAFAPKKVYRFPLSPHKLAEILPPLADEKEPVADAEALHRLLHARGIRCERVTVRKKRFQLHLQSCTKVEFCTLRAGGRKYFSVCVEGPDYAVVHAHAHNFRMDGVREMGYVEFLKHYRMEGVA